MGACQLLGNGIHQIASIRGAHIRDPTHQLLMQWLTHIGCFSVGLPCETNWRTALLLAVAANDLLWGRRRRKTELLSDTIKEVRYSAIFWIFASLVWLAYSM